MALLEACREQSGRVRIALLALALLACTKLARESLSGPVSPPTGALPAPAPRRLAVPETVLQAFELIAHGARQELVSGSREQAKPDVPWKTGANFQAVQISLPLAPPIIKHDPAVGDGEGDKNIVGLQLLGKSKKRCVVYGMGIAWESNFEQQMAKEGCETHAFDCTVDPASPVVAGKAFTFHNWCIGEGGSEFNTGNNYLRGRSADGLSFKTLSETMRLLGHDSVDVLKFDIEGFEWKLFDTEILSGKSLPRQLAFELHTEGSVPKAVPPHLVKGKGFVEVNRLFLALHDLGSLRSKVDRSHISSFVPHIVSTPKTTTMADADAIKKICDIYDWDGKGVLDLYFLGDVMYALGMNITKKICVGLGQTDEKDKKFAKFDDIVKLVQEAKNTKDNSGTTADYVELCKLYDKNANGTMMLAELENILSNLADEIPKEDTVALLTELCDKEDEDGFFPYKPFIDRLCAAGKE